VLGLRRRLSIGMTDGMSGRYRAAMSDYVTVERADNEAMADLIRQRLDENGIPCQLVPSNLSAVAGAGTAYAVTVPADRADEARELLGD
jgi:hypothetical protein